MNLELGEAWLAKRLEQHGCEIFAGLTDPAIRRERIRAAIIEHNLAAVVLGRGADGKPENYEVVFKRLYGQPLKAAHEPISEQG